MRFALLKVLEEIYTKLGEEFIILLPETIPFLAELMEGIIMYILCLSTVFVLILHKLNIKVVCGKGRQSLQ